MRNFQFRISILLPVAIISLPSALAGADINQGIKAVLVANKKSRLIQAGFQ
jgi:hypothetical protein